MPRLDRNITAPSIDTSKSASMLRALLAEYATPGGALDVPLEHLAIVAEQAEHLVNAKAPRRARAREEAPAPSGPRKKSKPMQVVRNEGGPHASGATEQSSNVI